MKTAESVTEGHPDQIGTVKHGSPFEKGHMKTVDQGFVYARFDSILGRIVCTETTFYSNDKAKTAEKRYDRRKTFDAFLDEMKIRRSSALRR